MKAWGSRDRTAYVAGAVDDEADDGARPWRHCPSGQPRKLEDNRMKLNRLNAATV